MVGDLAGSTAVGTINMTVGCSQTVGNGGIRAFTVLNADRSNDSLVISCGAGERGMRQSICSIGAFCLCTSDSINVWMLAHTPPVLVSVAAHMVPPGSSTP